MQDSLSYIKIIWQQRVYVTDKTDILNLRRLNILK